MNVFFCVYKSACSFFFFCGVSTVVRLVFLKYYICWNCKDTENGGISDRPDDAVDVFHTYFGVAGRVHLLPLFVFHLFLI